MEEGRRPEPVLPEGSVTSLFGASSTSSISTSTSSSSTSTSLPRSPLGVPPPPQPHSLPYTFASVPTASSPLSSLTTLAAAASSARQAVEPLFSSSSSTLPLPLHLQHDLHPHAPLSLAPPPAQEGVEQVRVEVEVEVGGGEVGKVGKVGGKGGGEEKGKGKGKGKGKKGRKNGMPKRPPGRPKKTVIVVSAEDIKKASQEPGVLLMSSKERAAADVLNVGGLMGADPSMALSQRLDLDPFEGPGGGSGGREGGEGGGRKRGGDAIVRPGGGKRSKGLAEGRGEEREGREERGEMRALMNSSLVEETVTSLMISSAGLGASGLIKRDAEEMKKDLHAEHALLRSMLRVYKDQMTRLNLERLALQERLPASS